MEGRDGGITAGELMEQLAKDPDYQAAMRERDRQSEARRREYFEAARPVLEELEAAGVRVEGDLMTIDGRENYAAALPILLRWLPKIDHEIVKETLVRGLTSKWARPEAARPLVDEFRRIAGREEKLGWLIGSALETVADESVRDDLLELATDRSFGRARGFLVTALGNIKDPRTEQALVELLDDPDVTAYAIMGLGKMKATAAAPAVERFLDHPDKWVRDHAKKALRNLR